MEFVCALVRLRRSAKLPHELENIIGTHHYLVKMELFSPSAQQSSKAMSSTSSVQQDKGKAPVMEPTCSSIVSLLAQQKGPQYSTWKERDHVCTPPTSAVTIEAKQMR